MTRTYTATLVSSLVPQDPPVFFVNTAAVPSYSSCVVAQANPECVVTGHTYPGVDDSTRVTTGQPSADLAIVKTPSGSTTPGTNWTFTMRVSNLGPSFAEGPIVVTDPLPNGLTFVSSGPGWACTASDQDVECTLEPTTRLPLGSPRGRWWPTWSSPSPSPRNPRTPPT